MALERGGIELIVKGFSNFIGSLGKANKAYDQMGKSAQSAAKQVTNAGNRVTSAQRSQKIALDNSRKAIDALANAESKLAIQAIKLERSQKIFEVMAKGFTEGKITVSEMASAMEDLTMATEEYNIAVRNVSNAELTRNNALERLAGSNQTLANAQQNYNDVLALGTSLGITSATVMKTLGVAVAGVGIALGVAAAAWGVFKKAIDIAVGVVKKLVDILKSAAQSVLGFFSRALSTAAGFGVYDIFRNITQGISNAVSEIGTAISFFQKLEIQLEALTARDISHEFGIPVAEAFGRITNKVTELDTWLKNLAVRTPFTASSIAETLAMANAMGLNIDAAKQMTKATIDFTSAMGLSEDHMFRIIYNFGQMLAQGKLNGREFRDLANSFVPVWEIMRRMGEQVGKTAEEFKELAFEGGVSVEAFFAEFVKMVEEDFAGAAGKMARTLEGVKNNFRDFMQIIMGTSVLGPVMDYIAERLALALDFLLRPEIRTAAEQIGKAILTSFRMIKNAGDELMSALGGLATAFGLPVPSANKLAFAIAFVGVALRRGIESITSFVNNLTKNLSTSFTSVAGKAASWGYNLVASFANGMASAINLIVAVINTISRILSYWFKGFSPPRIAKNIDKWGADMISEWVSGWTNFDISTFSELSSTVESFLRSIAYKIGGKDNVNLIPRILGSREVIAEAINGIRSGLLSVADAARKVFDQVGNLTGEFQDYIKALFDVEAAQKKVADAAKAIEEAQKKVADAQVYVDYANERIEKSQEELNAITERYEEILKRLNDELRKVTEEYDEQRRLNQINAAIGTGLLTDAEKERLEMEKRSIQIKQQIRQVEDERDAATGAVEDKIKAYEAERDAAQARVDALEDYVEQLEKAEEAAREELDAAQGRLDLIKAIIDEQIKQNDLVQEQIDLLKQLAEAAKSAGGGGGGVDDLTDSFGGLGGAIEKVNDQMRKFRLSDKRWVEQPANIAKAFADATKAFEDFELALGNLDAAMSPLTGEGGALTSLYSSIKGLVDLFVGGESPLERTLRIKEDNVGFIERLGIALIPVLDSMKAFPWDDVGESVVKVVEAFADLASDVDWAKIGQDISGFLDKVAEIITLFADDGEFRSTVFTSFSTMWSTIKIFTDLSKGDFSDAFTEMFDIVTSGKGSEIKTEIGNMLSNIYGKFSEFMGGEGSIITDILGPFWDMQYLGWLVLKKLLVDESVVPEMMQAIYDSMHTKYEEILTYFEDTWIVNMLSSAGTFFLDLITIHVVPGMQDMYDEISTKLGKTQTEWETRWGNFKTYVSGVWNDGDGIIAKIKKAMEDTAAFFGLDGTLATAISSFINNIITWATTQIGLLADALTALKDAWNKLKEASDGELQSGGLAMRGRKYVVGEAGREMFIPAQTGFVLPNWMTERLLAPQMASVQGGNTYITNVEVNPSYSNVQSEASVYYDISAALAAARR